MKNIYYKLIMAIVVTKGYPSNDLEYKNCTFCFVGEHATLQNQINESATRRKNVIYYSGE